MPDYSESDIADLMFRIPTAFQTAQADWAKFKLGLNRGLFDAGQKRAVADYYGQFPKLWEIVRPNFLQYPDGRTKPSHSIAFAKKVDAWIATFGSERRGFGLGVIPLLVIAGVLVAGAFGAAGLAWAVGYIKEQNNISGMISGVVDGTIPAEILQTAIEKEQFSPLSQLTDLFTYGLIAVGAFLLLPVIKDVVKKKEK